jgi:hypothetical protein
MANVNINNSMQYWYDGCSSLSIKATPSYNLGLLYYWYNANTNGYLDAIYFKTSRQYYTIIYF